MKAVSLQTAFHFIMLLNLKQVVPVFLEPEKVARSAVWNQTLSFTPGERIQIVAPSGSGKTSLIHFLYGMRRDYNGSIHIDQTDVAKADTEKLSQIRSEKLSIVFQDLRLFPGHSVYQNLEVKRSLNPFHPTSLINEMAERLGISNKLEKPVSTCSYGEQQRIAIIRCLQQPFEYLIMDEPFSHLDDRNRQIASELIEEEASARNAGILLADLKEIPFFNAQRVLHL